MNKSLLKRCGQANVKKAKTNEEIRRQCRMLECRPEAGLGEKTTIQEKEDIVKFIKSLT